METLEEVNKDPEFREFMSAEEDNKKIENSLRREAIESGRKEGIEQGSTKKALEIAKSMITKGVDIDLISELTGLSKEKIEKIQ